MNLSKKLWILMLIISKISFLKAETNEQYNVSIQLKSAIEAHHLHFPQLTSKIYLNRFYQSIWFNTGLNQQLLKQATALIFSAPQYGLSRLDFHCDQLSENNINNTIQNNLIDGFKPMLDVLLTDALLTFIAQIHYGKANEKYPLRNIDQPQFKGLKVDSVLLLAISRLDFNNPIKGIEPNFKGYQDLQKYTSLVAAQYPNDCNVVNDNDVKILALNLERWRWLNENRKPYAFINIPAYTLTYYYQDTTEEFKVIIGKPSTKTPILTSKIKFFTTAPSWVVPKSIIKKEIIPKVRNNASYFTNYHLSLYDEHGNIIYPSISNLTKAGDSSSDYSVVQSPGISNALGQIKFNFDNSFSVYLHDTPNRDLFNQSYRALSHGCIRVENPDRLVHLFLEDEKKNDVLPDVLDAMKQYKRRLVYLPNPIFIIIAYFTAEVKNGIFTTYKDLYEKDKSLEKILQMPIQNE